MPPPPTDQPITIALKPLMHARQLTFRALADLTRDRDPEGRGVTYAYLCALTSGREHPSPRSLELIAASLGIQPDLISDTCQTQVNESGFCPLDYIQSNTVRYTGNDFGFGGTSWRDLTVACAPDWVPMTRLFFEERGAWVAISTSLYGSGTGTFTRTWVGR